MEILRQKICRECTTLAYGKGYHQFLTLRLGLNRKELIMLTSSDVDVTALMRIIWLT